MARIYKKLSAGGGSGGGGGTTTKYIQSFNATSDWIAAGATHYTISIAQSSHNLGVNPVVHLFELVGLNYEEVNIDRIQMDSVGNLELRVTSNARFPGKVVIL